MEKNNKITVRRRENKDGRLENARLPPRGRSAPDLFFNNKTIKKEIQWLQFEQQVM